MQLALQSGGTGGDRVKRIAEDKEAVANSHGGRIKFFWPYKRLGSQRPCRGQAEQYGETR